MSVQKLTGPKLFTTIVVIAAASLAQSLPNAVPLPNPEVQFLGSNGVPLAGAYVCSYSPNTTTPAATFTDSTAGTPNTNPVVLDSAGRASIWIGPAGIKLVLRTGGTGNSCATGSVVWSQDNILDASLFLANYVKTVSTSSLITYQNPKSGSVSRTALSKFNDWLAVTDFGADPTGAADSTTAINNAIAVSILGSGSSTPGVCIYLPDGIYRVTTALTTSHTVCLVGNSWRLKYTNSSTITAVLSIIGDPTNTYGSHGTFMEGSIVQGAIIDGQGHATNGLTLQGVVSADIDRLRVTNVTGAGFNCNWCQQTHLNHLQVSTDFETFTTTPTNGLIIDNISSDNYITNINIDHVSGDGIAMKYALNTTIIGGTSEGNGGYGVNFTTGAAPFRQSFNNAIEQLDTEVNALGDICFCDTANNGGIINNSVFQLNSFSVPGITWSGSAHGNNVYGGEIGGGSTMSAGTYGNGLYGVGCIAIADPCITDSGQNILQPSMRNQSTGTVTQAFNNYNVTTTTRFSAASLFNLQQYTPSATLSEYRTGATAGPWMALTTQTGLAAWLVFPKTTPGLQFVDEATYRGTARPVGSIVNGRWGFGAFMTTPGAQFHVQDASVTSPVFQAGAGQGGADLSQWQAFNTAQGTLGTILSRMDFNGAFWGGVTVQKPGGGVDTYATLTARTACAGGTEGALGSISDATVNTWGTTVSVGGGANHVGIRCNGSVWTIFAK